MSAQATSNNAGSAWRGLECRQFVLPAQGGSRWAEKSLKPMTSEAAVGLARRWNQWRPRWRNRPPRPFDPAADPALPSFNEETNLWIYPELVSRQSLAQDLILGGLSGLDGELAGKKAGLILADLHNLQVRDLKLPQAGWPERPKARSILDDLWPSENFDFWNERFQNWKRGGPVSSPHWRSNPPGRRRLLARLPGKRRNPTRSGPHPGDGRRRRYRTPLSTRTHGLAARR